MASEDKDTSSNAIQQPKKNKKKSKKKNHKAIPPATAVNSKVPAISQVKTMPKKKNHKAIPPATAVNSKVPAISEVKTMPKNQDVIPSNRSVATSSQPASQPRFGVRALTVKCCCVGGVSLCLALIMLVRFDRQKLDGDASVSASEKYGTRLHLLDNAKVVAMFLVIYGHLLLYVAVPKDKGIQTRIKTSTPDINKWLLQYDTSPLLIAIKMVQMPLFCLVSGICSQGPPTVKKFRGLVTQLVFPLVIFSMLGGPLIVRPFEASANRNKPFPTWSAPFFNWGKGFWLWYLIALFVWRILALAYWHKLRSQTVILSALFITSLASYAELDFFPINNAMNACVGFLPYFAIGYVLPIKALMMKISGLPSRERLLLAGGTLVYIVWAVQPDNFGMLPLPDAHQSFPRYLSIHHLGAIDRSLLWTLRLTKVVMDTSICIPLLLFVIPREENFLTWVGPRTLYSYMFMGVGVHLWVILLGAVQRRYGACGWSSYGGFLVVLALHLVVSLVILLVLTSRPFTRLVKWCVEPELFVSDANQWCHGKPRPNKSEENAAQGWWRRAKSVGGEGSRILREVLYRFDTQKEELYP